MANQISEHKYNSHGLIKRSNHDKMSGETIAQVLVSIVSLFVLIFILGIFLISNPLEQGYNIAYANQEDPPTPTPNTQHLGTPQNGSMTNSVMISDTTGVRYTGSNANNKYTGNKIRDVLYDIANDWFNLHPNGPRIQINVISAENGGDIGHSSHQNGLDFDIRYIRNDNTEGPLTLPSTSYDQSKTEELVNLFVDTEKIDVIFTCTESGLSGSKINTNFASTHKNHLHIRFTNPSGWN